MYQSRFCEQVLVLILQHYQIVRNVRSASHFCTAAFGATLGLVVSLQVFCVSCPARPFLGTCLCPPSPPPGRCGLSFFVFVAQLVVTIFSCASTFRCCTRIVELAEFVQRGLSNSSSSHYATFPYSRFPCTGLQGIFLLLVLLFFTKKEISY